MPVSMPKKPVVEVMPNKQPKQDNNKIISTADFAAKITNKVNNTVKTEEIKQVNQIKAETPKQVNPEKTEPNYVTDDQFFDDFFADDDE